jgi:hypothetical protein
MRQPQHGHGPGGGGHENDEAHRLKRIEESVGRIEASVGATQGAMEKVLERILQMPVSQDVQDALDAVKGSLRGAAAKEHDEFLAAVQAARDEAAAQIDELTAKIDELIAKGGTASADELAAIKGLATDVDEAVDAIVPASTPTP